MDTTYNLNSFENITINDYTQVMKVINTIRLENKNKWYFINAIINGNTIQIKGFGTWLQVFKINDIDYSNCMERSISDFKKDIMRGLENGTL